MPTTRDNERDAREAGSSSPSPSRSNNPSSNPQGGADAYAAYSRSNRVSPESPNIAGTRRVDQSVIDRIMQMGMAAALDFARSPDADPEFREAVRRFYLGTGEEANREGVRNQGREFDSAIAERQGSTGASPPVERSAPASPPPGGFRAPSGFQGPPSAQTTETVNTHDRALNMAQEAGEVPHSPRTGMIPGTSHNVMRRANRTTSKVPMGAVDSNPSVASNPLAGLSSEELLPVLVALLEAAQQQ